MSTKFIVFLLVVSGLFLGQHQLVNAAKIKNEVSATNSLTASVSVEEKVREYFQDIPVMIDIARCESKFRQFTDAGNVLYGGAGGGMVGVYQFYEQIHSGTAKSLGFDLSTLDGNVGYARHLYNEEGTTPWNSAIDCWKYPLQGVSTTYSDSEQKLQIEMLHQIIALLRQILELQRVLAFK